MTTASTTFPTAIDSIPKPPETCPFCGAELKTTAIRFKTPRGWAERSGLPCFGSCGCNGSRRKLELMAAKGGRSRGIPRERRYELAEVPPRYAENPVKCADLLSAVKRERSAWIKGTNGTGKTAYAVSALMAWLDEGRKGLFAYAPDMVRRMAGEFDGDSMAYYERLCSTDLLVLDDLGKEEPTERRATAVTTVLNARWNSKLPTVVTSNFAPGDYVKRMEGSSTARGIVSRVLDGAFVKTMNGFDRRLA